MLLKSATIVQVCDRALSRAHDTAAKYHTVRTAFLTAFQDNLITMNSICEETYHRKSQLTMLRSEAVPPPLHRRTTGPL